MTMLSNLCRKSTPLAKMFNAALVDMPAPANLSSWWNFGSLLGMCLLIQIVTGLLISLHYSAHADHAFNSVVHICRDVNMGYLFRTMHANGASFFFICLYLHISRGVYYSSFTMANTWVSGVTILLLAMAAAFLGYVLPWGQMSFWGATVITNLLSTIPYIGTLAVQCLWGGFAVDSATLSRFFAFHFMVPFLILGIILIHVMFLHQTGSNNPMGLPSHYKMPLHPYFTWKDILGVTLVLSLFLAVNLFTPYLLGDPENFNPANPLSTPPHIQPEWYYLFAYAILRSIPNKLGGVIALVMSITLFYMLPFYNKKSLRSLQFYPVNQYIIWMFGINILLLTCIGARPVEDPYIFIGQLLTSTYFAFFIFNPILSQYWDTLKKYFSILA